MMIADLSIPYCARRSDAIRKARAAVEKERGHVYFADLPRGDVIKIGFSLNVEKRLRQIAANYATHGALTLRGKMPATIHHERNLHKALWAFSLKRALPSAGEFYCRTPMLDAVIEKLISREGVEDWTYAEWREFGRWLSPIACSEMPGWKQRWLAP